MDTASLISSDVQTAYLSGNLFSEVFVPTPVQPPVRLPKDFTKDNPRPLRVDGITIYEPKFGPRFTLFTERFIKNNDTLSDKRQELKRLQNPNLETKFEVKL